MITLDTLFSALTIFDACKLFNFSVHALNHPSEARRILYGYRRCLRLIIGKNGKLLIITIRDINVLYVTRKNIQ